MREHPGRGHIAFGRVRGESPGPVVHVHGHAACVQLAARKRADEALSDAISRLRAMQADLIAQKEALTAAQLEAQEHSQRYVDLFQSAPDGYVVTDLEGNIREANCASSRLLKVAPGKLVGQSLASFVVGRDNLAFWQQLLATTEVSQGPWQATLQSEDGAPFPAELSAARFAGTPNNPAGLRWSIRDVTARCRAEEANAEQLRFEMLLAELSSRLLKVPPDDVDREIGHALCEVAEFFKADRCAILGVRPEDRYISVTHVFYGNGTKRVPPDLNLAELFPWSYERFVIQRLPHVSSGPEDLPSEAEQDRKSCIALGTMSRMIVPIVTGNAVRHLINVQTTHKRRTWPEEYIPRVRAIGEILVNAIERRDSYRALAQSQERLSLAVESSNAGLWSVDIGSGEFWSTPKMRSLFGVGLAPTLTTETFLARLHPDDRIRIESNARESVARKQPSFKYEFRVLIHNDSARWLATTGQSHFDADGQLVRLTGLCTDITEQRQANENLVKALGEVQQLRDQLQQENLLLRQEIKLNGNYEEIIGQSPAIKRVLSQVEQVAATESTVLLLGETGTGKELVARAIHQLSPRRAKPMLVVNCAALPAGLVESELFGREKGAYTGALTREIGRFELAHQSTLFLDELAELPMELQAKLLRVLQHGEFERVGNPKPIRVNVRVIAATNRDLKKAIAEGRFREDLFYRLNVFPIEIPPLRQRPDDVPMMVWAFVTEFMNVMGKSIRAIPQSSMSELQHYAWPGNVRELRNVIERAMIVSCGPTLEVAIPDSPAIAAPRNSPLNLCELEKRHILEVLDRSRWRIRGSGGAAELLGLKPTTLEARMAKLGITRASAGRDA
jgi:formate hydrogenlyase transcriptional activator